jgi:Ca-activated chloride channel homolog
MTGRSFAALLLVATTGLPLGLHWPAWVERWLHNPGERTAAGLAAYGAKSYDRALPAFDSALRLAPGDPRVAFNAGAAEIAAGKPGDAVRPLAKAVEGAPPELAADAAYNLGTARLEAGDAAGAIDALKRSLRARPDSPDAKYNLELALRAQEEQKKPRAKPPEKGSKGDREDQGEQKESSRQPGAEQPPSDQPNRSPAADPAQQGERRPGEEGKKPLPQFHDQPDMSAEQAAAILKAVENLERQQRRKEALKQAKANASQESDW